MKKDYMAQYRTGIYVDRRSIQVGFGDLGFRLSQTSGSRRIKTERWDIFTSSDKTSQPKIAEISRAHYTNFLDNGQTNKYMVRAT